MKGQNSSLFLITLIIVGIFIIPTIGAHVPYLEPRDYSEENPFKVRNTIEQSIAVYAWLENDGSNPSTDIDVYQFEIGSDPMLVYIEAIVPVCGIYYQDFVPWFALVGPGLPAPNQTVPFTIPSGYGAIVKENVDPGDPRETFYEFFGGKWYYEGPTFEEEIGLPGTYYVYYWDPHEMGGDYVAVLGKTEEFGFRDIIRSLIVTPIIRFDFELHCPK
jgi:hypothetical protein